MGNLLVEILVGIMSKKLANFIANVVFIIMTSIAITQLKLPHPWDYVAAIVCGLTSGTLTKMILK